MVDRDELGNEARQWESFSEIITTPLFVKFINRPEKIIALFCLHGDEFLYTNEGCVPAKEIRVGDESLGGNTETNKPFDDDVYEVTFSNGNKVRCNLEHPFWWVPYKSSTKPKWKSLKDILSKKETVHGSKWGYGYFADASEFKLKQDTLQSAKLLGYLCSDGYITGATQSVKFTNNNKAFLGEVGRLVKHDFHGIDPKLYAKGKGFDLSLTEKGANYSGNSLKNYIKSLQITVDSYGDILKAKKQNLVEFVRGFFNGDGYLLIRSRKKGYSDTPHIEIGFCIGSSRRRAYEFQYILWKLGISSYICEETFKSAKRLFYRVKVNQTSIKECFDILEDTKYPEKFAIAKKLLLTKTSPKESCRKWVSIKSIKPIGRASLAGISTSTQHIYGVCGMKTHNTGNQWGKNVNIVKHYIVRWMGKHPIEAKNLRPSQKIRTYRFCSEKLPNDPENSDGDKSTIYPVLKRLLPSRMIKKDITSRNMVMTLKDFQGGPDFYVEFVSYNQDLQDQAGVQRASCYIDERCNRAFFEEQMPRLMASDGDLVIGMTPALGEVTWQFEEIYEKARILIRTKAIRDRIKERFNEDVPEEQYTGSGSDICVLMAASDDNPAYDILVKNKNEAEKNLIISGKHHIYKDLREWKPITKSEYIKDKLGTYDDETEDVRRYGIFRQVAGRIYKDYDSSIHVISEKTYFPDGIPHDWLHARGIDYHEHVDWHCGFITLSTNDEAFIYDEVVMSPEKYVTSQMAREIALHGKDFRYTINAIDPLATKTQVNTGLSTVDDLNRIFRELRRENIGTGGYWESWDSKSTRGREEIRKRLKNARMCGKPFNNKQMLNGRLQNIPTIWILSHCKVSIDQMKNWRLEEWTDRAKLETKEMKETPMQRYSHINTVWECLAKDQRFRARRISDYRPERHTAMQYGRH